MLTSANGRRAFDALALVVLVYAMILVGTFALTGIVPLTYDEAYNFNALSRHPIGYSLIRYDSPNNHLLFTFAQAVLVPDFFVDINPLLLRLPNLLYLAGGMLLALHLLVRVHGQRLTLATGAVIGVALVSPVVSMYLFVARGYLLGTLLLLGACYFISRPPAARPFTGWLLAAGAAYTVPTFGYALPGLFAVHLVRTMVAGERFNWRTSPLTRVIAILLVVYLPVAHELLGYTGTPAARGAGLDYVLWTLSESTNLRAGPGQHAASLVLAAAAVIALALSAPRAFGRSRSEELTGALFCVNVLLCAVSFLAVVSAAAALGLAAPPFARNALFVPAYLAIGVLAGLGGFGRGRLLVPVVAVLLANAAIGVEQIRSTMLAGDPNDFSRHYAVLTPTPLSRLTPVESLGVVEVRAPGWGGITAHPYADALDARLVHEPIEGAVRCDLGTHPPPDQQRVRITLAGGHVLELCY